MTTTRSSIRLFGLALTVLALTGLAACSSDSDKTASTTTSSSTGETKASAAGKPCVAVEKPLPEGAPDVPVKVGEPPTDLVVEDLVVGTGTAAETTSTVTVDYIGVACSSGVVFDDSYSRGQTATFPLAQVIAGWQTGLMGMKVGGTRLLGIPPGLAYGSEGAGPDIAPNETLWFVVEMKDVKAA